VIFAPVTLLALIEKHPHRFKKQALASILSGFGVNLVFFTGGLIYPEYIEIKASFIPAFIVATLVLITGILIKREKHDKERDKTRLL
jgi:hypothetical protein